MPKVSIQLNGVDLIDAVPSAIIHALSVEPAAVKSQYSELAKGGRLRQSFLRQSISVRLEVQFRAIGNPIKRAEAVDALNAWAMGGGKLTLSNRPGKCLFVECEKPASEGSLYASDAVASVVLTANVVPFWQAETPTTAETSYMHQGELLASMNMPGTTDTEMSAEIIVGDGPLYNLTVSTPKSSMTFAGETVTNEDGTTEQKPLAEADTTFKLFYENGALRILSGETSAFRFRSAESADDLILSPGENMVHITADAPVTVRLSAHGRWA